MEYFGLAVLLTVVSSFLFVLADSPKIIGPSLFFCTTTIVVIFLYDDNCRSYFFVRRQLSSFIVLLEAVAICPVPD
jgi:hypothetical protein